MMMTNATAGTVAMQFGWTGPNLCISTACAASAHAVGEAARLIRDGSADVVMSGGTEACLTGTAISAFARMTALSTRNDDPEHASRPFDADRDGFVMGEGAAALVLEPLGSRRCRAAPRSTARSSATAATPTRTTSLHPRPAAKGRPRACSSRSKTPGSPREQIGHVNAHGTSTPLNDAAEAEAIRKVFGDTPPPVTSTKGVTGHLVGAAGATEAVACVLAMRERAGAADREPRAARRRHPTRRRARTTPRSVAPAARAVELVRVRRAQRHADLRACVVTATPIHADADAAASASVREVDGRQVMWFRIAGGKHHGAIGAARRRDRRAGGAARRASSASRSSASSTRRAPSCVSTSRRCTRGASWPARSRASRARCRRCSPSPARACPDRRWHSASSTSS